MASLDLFGCNPLQIAAKLGPSWQAVLNRVGLKVIGMRLGSAWSIAMYIGIGTGVALGWCIH